MSSLRRVPALLLVLALLVTACGARLSEEQREFAISGGIGDPTGQQAGGGAAVGGEGTDLDLPEVGEQAEVDPEAQAEAEEAEAAEEAEEAEGGGGGGDGEEAWRSVPEGGNGGATDTGVTEEQVVVANVSDISGAVPGLFEDAQLAAAAYATYHNASEGPIFGRQVQVLPLDSRMDSGQNRQQYLRACDEALGVAGSMSAFEEGAVDPVESCGIPDVRATTTSQPMQRVDNVYSVLAQEPGVVTSAEYIHWAEEYPDAVGKAGYLVIDNETTRFQTSQNRSATEQYGYDWIYVQHVQVAETNYNGFVLDMMDAGVEFLTFQGDYSQAVRLANAMRQQDWWPEVFALQTNVYTPEFIESGGQAVEGTEIAVTTQLLEEIDQHEEMQLYRQWLGQVDPSAEPSSLGMQAWSAMKLFIEGLKEVGPEVTRDKMLEYLDGVRGWDGGGLHPPQEIGPKQLTSCVIIVEVSGGQYQRIEPDGGFRCEDPARLG